MLKKKISLTDNKSARQLALEDKETVAGILTESENKAKKAVSKYKTKLDKTPGNLCVFGRHNKEFNKKSI